MANENEYQGALERVQEILLTDYQMGDVLFDDTVDNTNLAELEKTLEAELDEEKTDLELLKEDREKIGNPNTLGNEIKEVIWEQFINQIGVNAGKDFIKENQGLTLDLSDDAHIQTPENFKNGKIATHNRKSAEQLKKNYDRYKNMPHKEFRDKYVDPGMDKTLKRAGTLKKEGIDYVTDIYTGRKIPTETKLPNGKNNPAAAQREHVKSSAMLYENPSLQMANSNEELASTINDSRNLQGYTTAERNNSKSDTQVENMNEKDRTKHMEEANKKAGEYIKQKEQEGEERLKQEGRESKKKEVFGLGKEALKSAIMTLLACLLKDIFAKLVEWFKSAEKSVKTLIAHIKDAISAFLINLKQHLKDAGNTVMTAIATAIIGPVVSLIKKALMVIKQAWSSLKEAINYLKDENNKNKPMSEKIIAIGKIVIAGTSTIGAVFLGEAISAALCAIPPLAVELPLIGSLASIIGIFMGSVIAGIIGAIAINRIDKKMAEMQKRENTKKQIEKHIEMLNTQGKLKIVKGKRLDKTKEEFINAVYERHIKLGEAIDISIKAIFEDEEETDNKSKLDEINHTLDEMKRNHD